MVIGLRTAPICISFVGSWTEQHNRTTVDDIMGKSEYERERERETKESRGTITAKKQAPMEKNSGSYSKETRPTKPRPF